MNALVVYESLWGNTKAVARAIAEGLGDGAVALATNQATLDRIAAADLIVAGAPLLGFNLPTASMRESIRSNPAHAGHPADLDRPSMRDWLDDLPKGCALCASFETRIWWSPGSAAKKIAAGLTDHGFRQLGEPAKFMVTGTYGPLKDGEIERARQWGQSLAHQVAE